MKNLLERVSPRTFHLLGALIWSIIIVGFFLLAIFAGNYAFAHVNAPHFVTCDGEIVIEETHVDVDGDGRAEYAKFVILGQKEPFAMLFADKKDHRKLKSGRILDKTYDSFKELRKDWPTICTAARAALKKEGIGL